MGLFRRRYRRSTIEAKISRAQSARLVAAQLTTDELPICQGLAILHADLISSLDVYAEQNGRRVANTPDLLEQPNPEEDRQDTLHKWVQSLWWTGNAYASHAGAGTRLATLEVLNPNRVTHLSDVFNDLRVAAWLIDGQQFDPSVLLHTKLNDDPRRGPLGRSPLDACAAALENYGWAYRYLADFYTSGGLPSMVLRSRTPLGPNPVPGDALGRTEAEIAQDQWVGARQAFRPAVMDQQWEVEAGPPPQDIEQTLKVLEFAAVEVCRLANVSPSIGNVMAGGSLTYSTVVDELHRWLVLSLGPTWITRLERSLSQLLPTGLTARFDLDSLNASAAAQIAGRAQATATTPPTPALRIA
jgi:phage portal protein BeeE